MARDDGSVRVPDGLVTRTYALAFQDTLMGLVRRVLAQSYTWNSSDRAVDSFRSLVCIYEGGFQPGSGAGNHPVGARLAFPFLRLSYFLDRAPDRSLQAPNSLLSSAR
ncbi:hypothetical protein Dimus_031896 [Dionaea muscipula]